MKISRPFTTVKKPHDTINKGTTLTEIIMWMVIAGVVMAAVYAASKGAFSTSDTSKELNAYNDMMAKTPRLLKNAGQYPYNGSADMTGTYIVMASGAPAGLTLVGTASSGSAGLTNTYGGDVSLAPVASSGGQKSGFSLTTAAIPQDACTVIATTLSSGANVVTTKVNGTSTSGPLTSAKAVQQCTADSGSTGNNTLIFISQS
ncbi:type 4 pilus major pilin [Yersinia mollaretii]|uniref:type 4 pilus major pilin n=1 Tax=Yersinia mollaretii TaxID=33060 RepID=UPI0011A11C36|nr:type 4 pilus major pilin [Yersinia mollaretii]